MYCHGIAYRSRSVMPQCTITVLYLHHLDSSPVAPLLQPLLLSSLPLSPSLARCGRTTLSSPPLSSPLLPSPPLPSPPLSSPPLAALLSSFMYSQFLRWSFIFHPFPTPSSSVRTPVPVYQYSLGVTLGHWSTSPPESLLCDYSQWGRPTQMIGVLNQ